MSKVLNAKEIGDAWSRKGSWFTKSVYGADDWNARMKQQYEDDINLAATLEAYQAVVVAVRERERFSDAFRAGEQWAIDVSLATPLGQMTPQSIAVRDALSAIPEEPVRVTQPEGQ